MLHHGYKLPDNLVPHPRFGRVPIRSGVEIPDEYEVARSARGMGPRITGFPESAIRADLARQTEAVISRKWYMDRLVDCRDCKRPFLFFALEQKYWYEDLGFNLSADCVHCPECRHRRHVHRRASRRYSSLVPRDDLDDAELAALVEDAVYLFRSGTIKSEPKLRRIKNLALARIPDEPATRAILALVDEVRSGGPIAVPVEPEPPPGEPTAPAEAEVPALSWEPAYLHFHEHARFLLGSGSTPGQIRAQFDFLTRYARQDSPSWASAPGAGGFLALARDAADAIDDALAGRPIRPTPPPISESPAPSP